jgi:hypothetical protein
LRSLRGVGQKCPGNVPKAQAFDEPAPDGIGNDNDASARQPFGLADEDVPAEDKTVLLGLFDFRRRWSCGKHPLEGCKICAGQV